MAEKKSKALVILSGGQDSTTTLFWAKEVFDEVHAITFDYGQRHSIELEAARKVGEMAGVASHEFIVVPGILKSSSPLTSDAPLEQYSNFEEMDKTIGNRVELTFVPMRNAFFFTVAANYAISIGVTDMVTGICQEDNANYPDCRNAFAVAFENMANLALGIEDIRLHAPLMYMTKAESVSFAWGMTNGCYEALAFSHTSYDGKYPPVDNNHSNVLRAHGFEEAGLPDPLVVRAVAEGLMEYPDTPNYSALRFECNTDGAGI